MATLLTLNNFETLLQTGFIINAAYLVIRMKMGSPVGEYVKTERDVRTRLKTLGGEEVKVAKAQLNRAARFSETLLRFFLKLASVSQYVALGSSFVLLLIAAFTKTHISENDAIGLLLLIYIPIPLSIGTFALASFLYLGQLERDIMKVAQAGNAIEDIKTTNRGKDRIARIENAMEHLESALGGRR